MLVWRKAPPTCHGYYSSLRERNLGVNAQQNHTDADEFGRWR
jgi:hypothetical protein